MLAISKGTLTCWQSQREHLHAGNLKGNTFLGFGSVVPKPKAVAEDIRQYFTDGRRVSFILERHLAQVMQGKLAPSEGAGYDLLDGRGGKWEVRSITRGGIYFCPSYMVGSGRSFAREGFITKLAKIAGYVISDVEGFPNIPYWIVPKETVHEWYNGGLLGAGTKISRQRALQLLNRNYP